MLIPTCDDDRIYDIVERKKNLFRPANKIQEAIGHVVVVADAAHAVGASYHGKMVGTLANFTNYSFISAKFCTVPVHKKRLDFAVYSGKNVA